MKNYSQLDFLNELRNINWLVVMNSQDVNEAWSIFKTIFTGVLDDIAPFKQVRIKGRTEPWMNSAILDFIKTKGYSIGICK